MERPLYDCVRSGWQGTTGVAPCWGTEHPSMAPPPSPFHHGASAVKKRRYAGNVSKAEEVCCASENVGAGQGGSEGHY